VWDPPLYEGRIPGRVVSVAKSAGQADVLTGDGILRLLEVELEGAGRVAASAVLDSLRMTLGLSASELIARLASLEQRLGSNHI
jgi:hypothetical protein